MTTTGCVSTETERTEMEGNGDYARAALDAIRAESPDLPDELAQMYALLVLIKGEATSLEDVHDAWAMWTAGARGIEHKSLVPFAVLTPEVQELDRPYMEAIHRAHRSVRNGRAA